MAVKKSENIKVINGATVDVSKYDPNRWAVFSLICEMQNAKYGSRYFPELLETIFGEEDYRRILKELEEAKGGELYIDDINDFFSQLSNEADLKNSSGSASNT